jgi:hypothetical protein
MAKKAPAAASDVPGRKAAPRKVGKSAARPVAGGVFRKGEKG